MEILDVINDKDEVIRQARENEIYEKKLLHRIIHILIFNDKGEMAMQYRSKYKPFCPNHWSTTVGGRVGAGESYEQAAKREFQEELNTLTDFEFLDKFHYKNLESGHQAMLTIYKTIYNGPFDINPEEVEKLAYFPIPKIKEMIGSGEKFHPELLFILKKHYFNK